MDQNVIDAIPLHWMSDALHLTASWFWRVGNPFPKG